ncbi:MAG: hypothetical protein KDD55_08785, partial [Bdellovibrionales bacterium]|nr:hypothetical protein [Bdellovibrionales bacterium]
KVLKIGHVNVIIEPGRERDWEEFVENAPPNSIALDGYVPGLPKQTEDGKHRAFDHHNNPKEAGNVPRKFLDATLLQVHKALRQGMASHHMINGHPEFHLYVNGWDEDVLMSIAQFVHYEMVTAEPCNPQITQLVKVTNDLDASAGEYAGDAGWKLLGQQTWLFEPYTKTLGKKMSVDDVSNVVEAFLRRFQCYLDGEAEWSEPKTGYDKVDELYNLDERPRGWAFIANMGPLARLVLRKEHTPYVRLVSDFKDGTYQYVIGRLGDRPSIPLADEAAILNAAENLLEPDRITENERWGATDIVGGSPRGKQSLITPEQMLRIQNALHAYEPEKWNGASVKEFVAGNLAGLLSLS